MTQESIADTYQNAIKIVRRAKRQRADLKSVSDKLNSIQKYLTAQAQHELAETLSAPADTTAAPETLPYLLFDKSTGKVVKDYATLEEAEDAGKEMLYWEVWSDGTRMIVVSNGYTKEHAARG